MIHTVWAPCAKIVDTSQLEKTLVVGWAEREGRVNVRELTTKILDMLSVCESSHTVIIVIIPH